MKMQLKINEVVPLIEYVRTLDGIYTKAQVKIGANKALFKGISALVEYGKEVAAFAHEYDFHGVQANGYWSLLRICIKYLDFGLKHYDVNNKKCTFNRQFESLVVSLVNGCQCIKKLREDSLKHGSNEGAACLPLPLQATDVKLTYKYFNDIITADFEKWEPFFDQFAGCYHNYWGHFITNLIFFGVSLLGTPGKDLLTFFTNHDFRKQNLVRLFKSFDSAVITFLTSLGENPINTKVFPFILHGLQPEVTRTVFIKRQKKYLIDYDMRDKRIFLTKGSPVYKWGQKRVRCRLLYTPATRAPRKSHSLVLHCHGGGFITGTPDSHEVYTRGWAKELPGVPILSIDHSLSPKHKFPVASQEILDVYLWLISGDPGVKRMLSFHPKRILVTGDSSGGLLMMILMITLNDIRKQFSDPSILLPTRFIGFYGSYTIEPKIIPSSILSCFHSLLLPTVFTTFIDDYLPDGRRPAASYGLESFLPKVVTDLWSTLTYPFKRIAWLSKKYFNMCSIPNPWFTRGEKGIKERLLKDMDFMRHPYLSPLNYDDFESLSHIPIHLITVSFEPILDQTVMMANKWKGPVTLEVFGELVHGFLNLAAFGGQYMEAYDEVIKRMKDALE